MLAMKDQLSPQPLFLSFLLCALLALSLPQVMHGQGAVNRDVGQPKSHSRNITGITCSDVAGGSKLTITADGPLDDYSTYRNGERFYVRLAQADAAQLGAMHGRGFADVQVQRNGADLILSFKLASGFSARAVQRGNQLIIHIGGEAHEMITGIIGPQTILNRPQAPMIQSTRTDVGRPSSANNGAAVDEFTAQGRTFAGQDKYDQAAAAYERALAL